MLAYLRPAALLARALLTVVVADAGAPAYLALAPAADMLAYLRSPALLALALLTVVVADAGVPAPCICFDNYGGISEQVDTACLPFIASLTGITTFFLFEIVDRLVRPVLSNTFSFFDALLLSLKK